MNENKEEIMLIDECCHNTKETWLNYKIKDYEICISCGVLIKGNKVKFFMI
jgi:hypothetical protein